MEIKVKAIMCIESKGAFLTHQRLVVEFIRALNSVDLMLISPCFISVKVRLKRTLLCRDSLVPVFDVS